MKTCDRIRDGSVCWRLTPYDDAWCRKPDCPGHRTADRATNKAHRWMSVPPKWRKPVPLDPDEAYDVRVTRTAIARFIGVHGGTETAAEAELRSMLEDFLRDAGQGRKPTGYWVLIHQGYQVVLSPDCLTMVDYTTSHAERSWSQVKAGVKSRFAADAKQRWRARHKLALSPPRMPTRSELRAAELPWRVPDVPVDDGGVL